MQRSFWIWSISGVLAVSACGGSRFSSDGHAGDSETSAGGSGANTYGSNTSSTGGVASSSTMSSSTDGTGTGGAETTSSATTGSGGTGGTAPCNLDCELARDEGGRVLCECAPQNGECMSDSDCDLATNLAECCPGCKQAYPKKLIDSEPCLVTDGASDPKCERPECAEVFCPAAACAEPVYAACQQNKCVAKDACPDGTIEEYGHCVTPCESDDDCVIATQAGTCCESCPAAYNRQTVEREECLVAAGEEAPSQCKPTQDCSVVLCPAVLCVAPGTATCQDDGRCIMEQRLDQ